LDKIELALEDVVDSVTRVVALVEHLEILKDFCKIAETVDREALGGRVETIIARAISFAKFKS
jgi:hypothetical protein